MRLITLILSLPCLLMAQIPVLLPTADTVRVSSTSALVSALSKAVKGRTVLLSDGTYSLATVWPLRIRVDSVTLYGASRDPSKVILKGAGFTSSNNQEELIKIEAAGVRLAYFTLRDGRANGVKLQTGANHDFLIHNCRFIDICERSIKGPDAPVSRNGIIRYSHFEQITPITSAIPNLNGDPPGDYIAGLDLMKIEGWKIHDNVFRNIRGMNGGGRAAVFLWNGCKAVTIERNVFQGNDRAIALGNPLNTVQGMDSGIVRNNLIIAGKDISLEICNSTGTEFSGNSIYSANPDYYRTIQLLNNGPNRFTRNTVMGKLYRISGALPDTSDNLWLTSTSVSGAPPAAVSPAPIYIKGDPYPVPAPYPVEVVKWDTLPPVVIREPYPMPYKVTEIETVKVYEMPKSITIQLNP